MQKWLTSTILATSLLMAGCSSISDIVSTDYDRDYTYLKTETELKQFVSKFKTKPVRQNNDYTFTPKQLGFTSDEQIATLEEVQQKYPDYFWTPVVLGVRSEWAKLYVKGLKQSQYVGYTRAGADTKGLQNYAFRSGSKTIISHIDTLSEATHNCSPKQNDTTLWLCYSQISIRAFSGSPKPKYR